MSGAHPRAFEPRPKICFHAIATIHLRRVPEPVLAVLELRERAPDEVVRSAARAGEMLSKLGERPVLVEVQAAGFTLVLGQERAIYVEQPLLPRA
jgi:hypothetical protein